MYIRGADEVDMEEDRKMGTCSTGFVLDLNKILNYLIDNDKFIAQIGDVKICYKGVIEDTANGARQVFVIERKID